MVSTYEAVVEKSLCMGAGLRSTFAQLGPGARVLALEELMSELVLQYPFYYYLWKRYWLMQLCILF